MNEQRSAPWLVGMVTLSVFINYIDRGNFSTASSLIADQLHLNEAQLGVLFSAFYVGYVPLMPFMGMLAAGVAIWSIAMFSTGLAGGFISLLAPRVLRGVGESAALPCASKIIAQSVAVARLGLANGILSCGYRVGPAVGTFLGGTLMICFGWRVVFLAFGAASLLWHWPWRRAEISTLAGSEATPGEQSIVPSFWRILRESSLWGASIGHLASNYTCYFILSWLPYYLVKSRGFSLEAMVGTASLAYAVDAVSALVIGRLADRWIRDAGNTTRIYKWIMAANHVAGFACHRRDSIPRRASRNCGAFRVPDCKRHIVSGTLRGPADHRGASRHRTMGRCAECVRQCRRPRRPQSRRVAGPCVGFLYFGLRRRGRRQPRGPRLLGVDHAEGGATRLGRRRRAAIARAGRRLRQRRTT
jgi:MFS family permease